MADEYSKQPTPPEHDQMLVNQSHELPPPPHSDMLFQKTSQKHWPFQIHLINWKGM